MPETAAAHDQTSDVLPAGMMAWAKAVKTATVLATAINNGHARFFRGIHLKAPCGPVREAWLSQLLAMLDETTPRTKITPETPPSRLLASVDIAASLAQGHTIRDPGLLARSEGGIVLLTGAERLSASLAVVIASAFDDASCENGFSLIAIDESEVDDEDGIAGCLASRLPVTVDLRTIAWHDICDTPLTAPEPVIQDHKAGNTPRSDIPDAAIELAASVCDALSHTSSRPALAMTEIASMMASMDGRDTVNADDMAEAIETVCGPILAGEPEQPESEPQNPEPEQPQNEAQDSRSDDEPDRDDDGEQQDSDFEALQDMLVEAVRAGKLHLPITIERSALRSGGAVHDGKSGQSRNGAHRGRPAGLVARPPFPGARLDVVSTLRTAAPWQKLRARAYEAAGQEAPSRPMIRPSDYRYIRHRQPTESIAIFAVDASGSTALDRLAEAKGAIEQLLAECYVRRDQVALLAFRGQDCETILEPTRSLVRAKRSLTGLPGGGATPLAHGLKRGIELAIDVRRKGKTPLLVMLTDGRGNIALDGSANRSTARADAERVAKLAVANTIPTVFIDIARRPRDQSRDLASAMAADYCALPTLDAGSVTRIVSSYMEPGAQR